MKKIFGAICVLFFLVTACAKDEVAENSESLSVVGVWGIENGEEFSYLTLLPNNTFLYAENDLIINSNAENGLELGTYIYDSSKDNIIFNIAYDDNDPGRDSGIGNIGTLSTLNATILDESSRLSLEDGELIFNKMDLTATSPIIGVWGIENGEEFSYLTLLSNNTFIHAENDLTINSNAENGLEVGTYVYDPSKEELTFEIAYDDNDPGKDSGVGNTGSLNATNAVLSNDDKTLTIADLVLTKAL